MLQIQGQPGVCIKTLSSKQTNKQTKENKPTSPSTKTRGRQASKRPVPRAVWVLQFTSSLEEGQAEIGIKGCLVGTCRSSTLPLGECFRDGWKGLAALAFYLLIDPCHPKSCFRNNHKSARASPGSFSEQIRQEEARRLGFDTVDPEVGTAGMVLVSSIGQLETVCF